MSAILDLPERFGSWLGDVVNRHFRFLAGLVLAAWLATMFGIIEIPNLELPLWARVAGTFGALAAVVGYALASIRFDEPEPDWNYVLEFNFDDPRTPRISKATDAVIQDMDVVGGRLRSPQGNGNLYVCRWWNRDSESPVAHCTWADLPDDTDLLGVSPSAIEREITALRDTYERTHGRYQWVLDHLYMVVRRLDFRRSRSQNAVLEGHVAPSSDDGSIADVVDEIIPDELRPDRFEAPDNVEGEDDGPIETVENDLEDAATTSAAPETAATDGGRTDE